MLDVTLRHNSPAARPSSRPGAGGIAGEPNAVRHHALRCSELAAAAVRAAAVEGTAISGVAPPAVSFTQVLMAYTAAEYINFEPVSTVLRCRPNDNKSTIQSGAPTTIAPRESRLAHRRRQRNDRLGRFHDLESGERPDVTHV